MRLTVSSKHHIVIPKEIRTALNIHPGDKLEIFTKENRLELIPVRNVKDKQGFLKGMDTSISRDDDRV